MRKANAVSSTPSPPANDGTAKRRASTEQRRTVRSLLCAASEARQAAPTTSPCEVCSVSVELRASRSPHPLAAPPSQASGAVMESRRQFHGHRHLHVSVTCSVLAIPATGRGGGAGRRAGVVCVVQMIQSTPCLSRVMPTMQQIKNATELLQG